MKHAVELDTLDIVDRLDKLRLKAAALATGICGAGHDDASGGLEYIAWELHDELDKISDEIHPNGTGVPDAKAAAA
jgi:hypothetical protein